MGVSGIPLVGVGCHGVEFWVDGKVIHLRALSGGSVMRGVQICPRGRSEASTAPQSDIRAGQEDTPSPKCHGGKKDDFLDLKSW